MPQMRVQLASRQLKSAIPSVRFSTASRKHVVAMASLDVYVKGDPVNNVLADCPFCHKVLLTLENKQVPYTKKYIDFANKPEWLAERSGGKVPVINNGDFWLPDSDKIVEYLEENYPEPSMKSTVPPEVGAKFFGAFREFLKSSEEEAKAKEAAFLSELKNLDDYLAANGPLFGGESLNATDASLAPKIYHAKVALKHYKAFEFPAELKALSKYWDTLTALPTWKNALYSEALIIKGWATPH